MLLLICLALISSQCEIPSYKPRLSWRFSLPFSRKKSCWLPFRRALDRARAENRMIKPRSKPLLLLCDFQNSILSHSDAPPAPGINHLLTEEEWKAISFTGDFPPWNSIAVWLFLRADVETEDKFSFSVFIFFAVTARKVLKSYAIMAWTPFNVCCGRHGTVMISAPYIPSAGCNLLGEASLHRAETSEAVTET